MHLLHHRLLFEVATLAARSKHLEVAAVEGEARVLDRLIDLLGKSRGPGVERAVVNLDERRLAGAGATAQRHHLENVGPLEAPGFLSERDRERLRLRTEQVLE